MNRFLITSLMAVLLVGLPGCSLDEQILDTPKAGTSVRSDGDIRTVLAGAYGSLQGFNGFKFGVSSLVMLAADDISSIQGNVGELGRKTFTGANTSVQGAWTALFQTINTANYLLEQLEQAASATQPVKTQAAAECRYLRAFSYFYAVRIWGGVPLRTRSTDANTDFSLPRNTVDEIYAQIFADLRAASPGLPTRSKLAASDLGRPTKGAAQALLSKAYLTYAAYLDQKAEAKSRTNYEQASLYADSVINSNEYKLLPFADLWNVEKEKDAYQEVIFGLRYTRDPAVAQAQALGSDFAAYFLSAQMPNVAGNGASKTGTGQFRVQPWFYDYITSGDYKGDYRTEVSFVTRYVNLAGRTVAVYPTIAATTDLTDTAPYVFKYVDPRATDGRNHENDLFVTRLAEVYLIRAEAENELNGPTAAAYVAFNRVRERARRADGTVRTIPADLPRTLTQQEFRQKLLDERAIELVGELHRWFDLVRLKAPTGKTMYEYQFGTVLPKITAGLPRWTATTRRWDGGRTEATNLPVFNARYLLFPISNNEILINNKIGQNPGY